MKLLPLACFALLGAAPALAREAPPPAPVETVVDDYYGTKVADPYRWMESGKDPRWMPWLEAQAKHARAALDALPGRAQLLADIAARSGALTAVRSVQAAGGTMLSLQRAPGAQDFKLMVQRGHGKAPQVLVDGATAIPGRPLVIDGFSLSPDGRQAAVRMSKRGTERSELFIVDTASGAIRDEKLIDIAAVSWLPGGQGFFYLKFVGEHGTPSYYVGSQARVRLLGPAPADRAIPTRGEPGVAATPQQWALVVTEPTSSLAYLVVRDGRSEFALYRSPLAAAVSGSPSWTRIADFADTIVDASPAGGHLYLTSRKSSSNGEVLLLDAATGSVATARKIAVPREPVVEQITATRSGVLIETIEDVASGLWLARRGEDPRKLALPFDGELAWLENDPGRDDALLSLGGWFVPPTVFHLAENGEFHDIGMVEKPSYDTSSYEARRLTARAKDGTAIPFTVVSRKGLGAGPHPLLLEAYGSYGTAELPWYRSTMFPFLDRGGVWVLANVRGGGEFGRAWHEAGKGPTKANTWNDAIAVGEALLASGLTSPRHMSVIGTSAGGVMVGGAVNARPDLFTGAIANVGFMNPIRYVSEQNFADIEEWGGPITDAQSFRTMFGLDPYANIRPGTRYPATLVISGINDPRAATFHSAKYAARLAAATTSGEPVLLRIDFDAGHGGGFGSSRSQTDQLWADVLAFTLWQAGAKDFQPAHPIPTGK